MFLDFSRLLSNWSCEKNIIDNNNKDDEKLVITSKRR